MEIMKQVSKRQWAIGVGGIIIIALVVLSVADRAQAPTAPSETATSTEATTTPTATAPAKTTTAPEFVYEGPFPINSADTITSWTFKGAYTGNETLVAQAKADVAKLTNLLGKGQYDDYDLYVGIGNDFNLLGDGHTAYQYYNRASQVHPGKGLAYLNLGHLFDELGAYNTAADAYKKATTVEPHTLTYHTERLSYLTRQFPNDTARITAALADVSKVFGDTPPVLTIEARWLEGQGRYADAIKAWKIVKMLSAGKDTSAIDAAIAADEAKLAQ